MSADNREDPAGEMGGEPFWVVVVEYSDGDLASTAIDAPTRDAAEPEGLRVIVGNEGREPDRVCRVTGPFPNHVRTEDREKRPGACVGCGQQRYCGNHAPAPHQTWFVEADVESDPGVVVWKCITCGTLTYVSDPLGE